MNKIILAFAVMSIVVWQSQASAERAPADLLETAAASYLEGRFSEAAADYLQVIGSGIQHSSVYFNLGNSYYKAGQRGQALAAYFRAYELAPRDQGLKSNIAMVMAANRDAVEWAWPVPVWLKSLSLYGLVSAKELYYFTGFSMALAGIFLGLWAQRRQPLGVLRFLSIIMVVVSLYGLVVASMVSRIWPKWGAVSTDLTQIYSSPSEQSGLVVFELSEGAPVLVLEPREGWYRIQLSDRKQGWIAPGHLAL